MKWLSVLVCILVCKFSLNYWVMLPNIEKKNITLSVACEFAQKARGKAKAFVVVNPESWEVEIHAEMVEVGL